MFLRIYSVFFLFLYLYLTFTPGNLRVCGIWEWIDIGFMLCGIGGMASYAFNFRFFIKKFWEYFFYLFIIFELLYMTWLQIPFLEKLDIKEHVGISNFINIIMMIPVAIGLYQLQSKWEFDAGDAPPQS